MTRQQFDPGTGQFNEQADEALTRAQIDATAAELYDRIGAEFPVRWEDGGRSPVIDTEDLPDGTTTDEVAAVLQEVMPP